MYLFLERGEGREKERERSINQLPLIHAPSRGDWAHTQAQALMGIELETLHLAGQYPTDRATPVRAMVIFFFNCYNLAH